MRFRTCISAACISALVGAGALIGTTAPVGAASPTVCDGNSYHGCYVYSAPSSRDPVGFIANASRVTMVCWENAEWWYIPEGRDSTWTNRWFKIERTGQTVKFWMLATEVFNQTVVGHC